MYRKTTWNSCREAAPVRLLHQSWSETWGPETWEPHCKLLVFAADCYVNAFCLHQWYIMYGIVSDRRKQIGLGNKELETRADMTQLTQVLLNGGQDCCGSEKRLIRNLSRAWAISLMHYDVLECKTAWNPTDKMHGWIALQTQWRVSPQLSQRIYCFTNTFPFQRKDSQIIYHL